MVCIIICGPTAVGKTSLAIDLAKLYNTSIISADSRQCYKELNIGVARPTQQELNSIHHYFIASHSITDHVNAKTFEEYALQSIKEIFAEKDVAVMVGGTGLYIKAFAQGLDDIVAIPLLIREEVNKNYEEHGLHWLQEMIKTRDPKFYERGEIQNPARLIRALEVVLATGRSITELQEGKKLKRDFSIIKIGLTTNRESLYEKINQRVDQMMKHGLLAEVRSLVEYRNLKGMNTVGYSELFDHFQGKLSLAEAVEEIKKNSRRYAKRQLTWFKKDPEIKWFNTDQGFNEIRDFVIEHVESKDFL